jgi:hypothetical protein
MISFPSMRRGKILFRRLIKGMLDVSINAKARLAAQIYAVLRFFLKSTRA